MKTEHEHCEDAGSDVVADGGLHRRLNNRQIQLITIGGTIGTGLFVSIGAALAKGGPVNLLICFLLYSCVVALVNNSIAEMVTYMPVSGGFIRLAGEWFDDTLGFMVGWNFFLYETLLIPFEIVALNTVLSFWALGISEPGPLAGFCVGAIVSYGIINAVAVNIFGEAEFWLSAGKVTLAFMLFGFTIITMAGGNLQGDAYGFRNWHTPGAFATFTSTGDLGRLEGFMGVLITAVFIIIGPDYILWWPLRQSTPADISNQPSRQYTFASVSFLLEVPWQLGL
ncbi:General amino acid permease AGP2 [Colletotrichum viniferum]|nr:General amino acid permease AGP2 [Colletotrichum viniferum]